MLKVDGLRQLLNQPSDDEEEYENTSSSSSARDKPSPETFFIFRSNVETTDLRLLHPSPPHIAILCDVFFSRVDPLFKVLHKPTVKASILTAAENLDQIVSSEGHESLMFTIYFAAVTSLTQEECIKLFHRDRERLLVHYKYGTEAALANADFLNSMELVTLQAFVIFLVRRSLGLVADICPYQCYSFHFHLEVEDGGVLNGLSRLTKPLRCVCAVTVRAVRRGR